MFIPLTRDFFNMLCWLAGFGGSSKVRFLDHTKSITTPFLHRNNILPKKIFVGVNFWWTFYLKVKIDGLRIPILVDE